MSKTTDWSVNLFEVNEDPLANLLKTGPSLIFDIFIHFFRWATGQYVSLEKYLALAGIENKNYSGHSLRSGFATVSAESGADERSIMAMTGHKTTQMVRRYIKEANLFKNNALNKIKV